MVEFLRARAVSRELSSNVATLIHNFDQTILLYNHLQDQM